MAQEMTQKRSMEAEHRERTVSPAAAIRETEKGFLVELDMPGVTREDIDIRFERGQFTVTGRRRETVPKDYAALYRGRAPFDYERGFTVNAEIDAGKITAAYENGVLTVTLPKSERMQPKRIQVQ